MCKPVARTGEPPILHGGWPGQLRTTIRAAASFQAALQLLTGCPAHACMLGALALRARASQPILGAPSVVGLRVLLRCITGLVSSTTC